MNPILNTEDFRAPQFRPAESRLTGRKKSKNIYTYFFDSGLHYVAQASLELVIFLPECRNIGVRHNTSSEQSSVFSITGSDYHLSVRKTKRSYQITQSGVVCAQTHHRKRKQRSTG